jgi:hypothetical protein
MGRAHADFHEGAAGMARQIRVSLKVTWPDLVQDCQTHVKKCLKCQRFNSGRHGYHGSYVMLKVDEKGPKYKARYEGPFMVLGREASGRWD